MNTALTLTIKCREKHDILVQTSSKFANKTEHSDSVKTRSPFAPVLKKKILFLSLNKGYTEYRVLPIVREAC